jgi:hypothetical protein
MRPSDPKPPIHLEYATPSDYRWRRIRRFALLAAIIIAASALVAFVVMRLFNWV